MLTNKIKAVIAVLSMVVSANAQAKFVDFQESFSGTLFPSVVLDPLYFTGQTTFVNGDVSLTTYHEVFNALPDLYVAFGTFTRTDSLGSLSGYFDFSTSLPDYGYPPDPNAFIITGSFNQDQNSDLPNTGEYQHGYGYGTLYGYLTGQDQVNFTINWHIFTPDVISEVPAPPMALLFAGGLLVIGGVARRQQLSKSK